MQAITLHGTDLAFEPSWPEPTPDQAEVLVRVTMAGICETDLQLAQGYMGFQGIPGHEFVGTAMSGKHAGRRVVGEINCSCHNCSTCFAGRPTHCPNRTVLGIDRHDGAFAQWVAVPERNLHALSDRVGDDQAVLIEPLAAAFEIIEQVSLRGTENIAVLGDGRLGYLSSIVLSDMLTSGTILSIGKHASKLERFQQAGLPTFQIEDPAEVELPPKQFDLVVDCTGSTSGLPMALRLVRPRGTVVLKTTVASDHQMSLAAIVIDEINVVGSRCGPFSKACQVLEKQQIDLHKLITHRYRLDQVKEAFEMASNPGCFKVVFEMSS